MSRKPRNMSSSGIYHIILRSVNQHIIFEDDSDYQKFLFVLSDCVKKYDSRIYAYCLMANHFHLLIREREEKVGETVKRIASSYVYYYNKKYGRDGHLFKERFKSMPEGQVSDINLN